MSNGYHPYRPFIRHIAVPNLLFFLLLVGGLVKTRWADARQTDQNNSGPLKQVSLEQLGDIEVTTASKEPEQLRRTPAAIYALTQEHIRRSGATSIPDILRLVPAEAMPIKASSAFALEEGTARTSTTESTVRASPAVPSFIPITMSSTTGGWARAVSERIGTCAVATS